MSFYRDENITFLKNKLDIVIVIESFLKLTLKGKNYWAICPFHKDSAPSMSISQEKQIYKCFSCDESGDVLTFIIKYKKLPFKAAIEELAKIAKVNLNEIFPNFKQEKIPDQLKLIFNLNKDAEIFFSYQWHCDISNQLSLYLEKRNLNTEIISFFNIGYSGKNNELYNFLKAKNYDEIDIVANGLAKINKKNIIEDYFYNRIIFPIYDINSRCIGFIGRIYENINQVKYLNSPETALFKKNNVLYNLQNAFSTEDDHIILVEGILDVISCFKIGIKNTLALMGSSLSQENLILLSKKKKKIVIFLDNDNAGISATLKIIKNCWKMNIHPYIISLSKFKDPDEIIQNDLKLFWKIFNNRISDFDFILNHYKDKFNFNSFDEINEFLNTIKEFLIFSQEQFFLDVCYEKIANFLNKDKNIIIDFYKKNSKQHTINTSSKKNISKQSFLLSKLSRVEKCQEEILFMMLNWKEAFDYWETNDIFFSNDKYRDIYFILKKSYNELDAERIILEDLKKYTNSDIFNYCQNIINNYKKYIKTYEKLLMQENIIIIKNEIIDQKIRFLKNKIIQNIPEEEQNKIIEEIIFLNKKK